jgi:arsenate reductase
MAEAFLNQLGRNRFKAESAGLNPKVILSAAAEVMQEIGLGISDRPTKSVFNLHRHGRVYDYVITVCYPSSVTECPAFDKPAFHLHWTFAEPSQFKGTKKEIVDQTRQVRDQIHWKIIQWLN